MKNTFKNIHQNTLKNNQGIALIMTLLIVGAVGTLVGGSLILSMTNQRISRNDVRAAQAVNIAQAGSAYWKAELVSLYNYMLENFDDYEDDLAAYIAAGGSYITCNNYFAMGFDVNRDGTITTAERPPYKTSSLSIPSGGTVGNSISTLDVDGALIVIDSVASINDARSTVTEEFMISNVDMWNNAVFAGESAAGASTINGRAEIRGSVHILGEDAITGTPLASTDQALDVSGTFGMGNTYTNINAALNVDTASMRLSDDDPDDLCATLRVKHGYVNMDADSTLGYDDANPDDAINHNLRGIYTNDGIAGGIEVSTSPTGAPTNQNIFSSNGMSAKYDAGDSFKFPTLTETITLPDNTTTTRHDQLIETALTISTDPALDDRANLDIYYSSADVASLNTGDFYLSSGCDADLFGTPIPTTATPTVYQTPPPSHWQLATLPAKGFANLVMAASPLSPTVATLTSTLAHHNVHHTRGDSSNSTGTGTVATGFVLDYANTPDFACKKYRVTGTSANILDDEIVAEITWDQSAQELYVGGTDGVIRFAGDDVTITGMGGAQTEIGYKGKGILYADDIVVADGGSGGNFEMEVDFLPAEGVAIKGNGKGNGEPQTGVDNSYPATTIVGLVAGKSIVTSGAQDRFTAAMYAQESVDVTMQSLVAGAIVTNKFDAGSQVPTVLYVPHLSVQLPRLMPGAGGTAFTVSDVAWSRR